MKRVLVVLLVLAACGGTASSGTPPAESLSGVEVRIVDIERHVRLWLEADTIETARANAEAAANLVVGPNGPGYGDRDGDGVVGGEAEAGLLPGEDGTPDGLVTAVLGDNGCAFDIHGGPWVDPQRRWGKMLTAIDEWTPSNNTYPSLTSHPMRIVGWASLTLGTDDLEEAVEYAGHALLHAQISQRDLADC